MTGLMLKDIFVMRKTLKTYLLFLLFYLALSVLGLFSISFVTAFIQVMVMMLPIGAFSYDEVAKWDRYALTFPLNRRSLVGGRYLFTMVTVVGAALFGLLACVLLSILGDRENLAENLITVMVSLAVGIAIADIILPLCYKLGPERARPYLYVVVFVPILLLFGAYKLGLLDSMDLSGLNSLSDGAALALAALCPLAALAGLGVSYLISCRVMEGKEF